jgi:hypothetical protein
LEKLAALFEQVLKEISDCLERGENVKQPFEADLTLPSALPQFVRRGIKERAEDARPCIPVLAA